MSIQNWLKQDTGQFNLVMGDNGIGKTRFLDSFKTDTGKFTRIEHERYLAVLEDMQPFIRNQEMEGIPVSQQPKMFGGGQWAIYGLLIEIYHSPGKTVTADEVAASIHFRRLPAFWATILKAADKHGVTLFLSTHRLEVAEHFAKALAKMPELQDRARAITLYRTKNGEVKARVREFDDFFESLDAGYNIMGGD